MSLPWVADPSSEDESERAMSPDGNDFPEDVDASSPKTILMAGQTPSPRDLSLRQDSPDGNEYPDGMADNSFLAPNVEDDEQYEDEEDEHVDVVGVDDDAPQIIHAVVKIEDIDEDDEETMDDSSENIVFGDESIVDRDTDEGQQEDVVGGNTDDPDPEVEVHHVVVKVEDIDEDDDDIMEVAVVQRPPKPVSKNPFPHYRPFLKVEANSDHEMNTSFIKAEDIKKEFDVDGEPIDTKVGIIDSLQLIPTQHDYIKKHMPEIGISTQWVTDQDALYTVIKRGLEAGYRMIDVYQSSNNENAIGDCLESILPEFDLKRDEIFLCLYITVAPYGSCKRMRVAVAKSFEKLKVRYTDLLMLEWPCSKGQELNPYNKMTRPQIWTMMEEFYKEEMTRAIGVANYEVDHLAGLIYCCDIRPAFVQIEFHPYFQNDEVLKFCVNHNYMLGAIGSVGSEAHQDLINEPIIRCLAEKHQCSPGLIAVAYAFHRGFRSFPRVSSLEDLDEYIHVAQIKLTMDEIDAIEELPTRPRLWEDSSKVV